MIVTRASAGLLTMKSFNLVGLQLLFLCCYAANAQITDVGNLSPCTLSCLLPPFEAANCSLTSIDCQCNNTRITESVVRCMISNCTIPESFSLGLLRDQVCQLPPESRSTELLIAKLTLSSIAVLSILLRLLSRYLVGRTLYLDDYATIVSLAIAIPMCATGSWMVTNGLGQHTWYIDAETFMKILQIFWTDEILYVVIIMVTKLSILLFYLRAFQSRRFRFWVKATIGFVTLPAITFMFLLCLQCAPIAYNWDKRIVDGKCLDINAITYSHAAINIFQDFLILLMPIRELMSLKLGLHQKIGVFFMFQIGIFACITSIVRLRFLFKFGGSDSTDPLWENSDVAIWTAAEYCVAIICSCLPAIRALFKAGRNKAISKPNPPTNRHGEPRTVALSSSRASYEESKSPVQLAGTEMALADHDTKRDKAAENEHVLNLDKTLPGTPTFRFSWATNQITTEAEGPR